MCKASSLGTNLGARVMVFPQCSLYQQSGSNPYIPCFLWHSQYLLQFSVTKMTLLNLIFLFILQQKEFTFGKQISNYRIEYSFFRVYPSDIVINPNEGSLTFLKVSWFPWRIISFLSLPTPHLYTSYCAKKYICIRHEALYSIWGAYI